MLMWDAGRNVPALANTSVYAAALNGNRFFADRDGKLDALVRVRRLFPTIGLAAGVSLQFGNQVIPPKSDADANVTIVGADAQLTFRRLGLRVEAVRGTMPSTLLSLETEFAPGFARGLITSGFTTGAIYRLSDSDQVYGRFDFLSGDPVTGAAARAGDVGYRRVLDEHAHLGVNWQWKNRATFNDDEVNTRFQVTLGVVF
jgi:hypothetical protein